MENLKEKATYIDLNNNFIENKEFYLEMFPNIINGFARICFTVNHLFIK